IPTIAPPMEDLAASSLVQSARESTPDNPLPSILWAPNGERRTSDSVRRLTSAELTWMVEAAMQIWRDAGLSADELARMEAMRFELADLPNGQLALATSTLVKIDETAASYGWFVDPRPRENANFE